MRLTATEQRRAASAGLVLMVVSSGAFLASLDLFIVNIAFPSINDAFPGSTPASLSWILNGYTISFAALLAPAGRTADRIGRRRVFLAGLIVFMASSAGAAAVMFGNPRHVVNRYQKAAATFVLGRIGG